MNRVNKIFSQGRQSYQSATATKGHQSYQSCQSATAIKAKVGTGMA